MEDVDLGRFRNRQSAADSTEKPYHSAKFRGPRSGGAEDLSLQSCYGFSTGRYCSLLVPANAHITLI
jgi:hypothetical protein